ARGGFMSALEMRAQSPSSTSLADLLERVLDKGIVIAGDVQVNLLDIELLTLKLRLLIASADTAKSMGIDWWEHDQELSSREGGRSSPSPGSPTGCDRSCSTSRRATSTTRRGSNGSCGSTTSCCSARSKREPSCPSASARPSPTERRSTSGSNATAKPFLPSS